MAQQPSVVLRQQWQLQRLIGRVPEQRLLEQILSQDIPQRRGRTIVITGPLGSGRAALARFALWESLYKLPRSYEIDAPTGKLYLDPPPEDTQGLLRWEARGAAARRAILGDIAQRLPFPIGTIVAALTSQLPETQQQERKARLSAAIAPRDLLALVADAAGHAPFALHITGLDASDLERQWLEVIDELARFIHHRWPVLLLITTESPRPLMLLQEYQATTLQWKVRALIEGDIAENWHLGPVSKADVAHYVHEPADDLVIERLHTLSGGWPLMVQALWRDWRNSAQKATGGGERVPILTGDGFAEPWRFTAQGVRTAQHVDALRDALLDAYPDGPDMLAVLLDEDEDPTATLEYIFGVATLEGASFTGQAVAQACDLPWDDGLEEVFDALVTAGLLIDDPDGYVDVPMETGTQRLYRYRFALPIWWHLFHEGLALDEQREMAGALAAALQACYGRSAWYRLIAITRLWEQSGNEGLARFNRHLFDQWAHISALEAQARDAEKHAHQRGTWLDAHRAWLAVAHAMRGYVKDEVTFKTFEHARTLAERAGSPIAIAQTLASMANWANVRGRWETGEQWAKHGLMLVEPYCDHDAQRTRGRLWHEIGRVYEERKEWAEALRYLEQARVLEEAHGEPGSLAVMLHEIGRVYEERKEWAEALDYYQQARVLKEAHGEPGSLAVTLYQIGRVYQARKEWAEALRYLEQARVLEEAHGEPAELAVMLHVIGLVYQEQGQVDMAQVYFQRAQDGAPRHPDTPDAHLANT